jgi:glutathione S-transferase
MRHLSETLEKYHEEGKPWIFGHEPTILDAHAAVLAYRMMDLGRDDLLPDIIRRYATAVRETKEWKKVTHGRPTVWNISLGPAAHLNPL